MSIEEQIQNDPNISSAFKGALAHMPPLPDEDNPDDPVTHQRIAQLKVWECFYEQRLIRDREKLYDVRHRIMQLENRV